MLRLFTASLLFSKIAVAISEISSGKPPSGGHTLMPIPTMA